MDDTRMVQLSTLTGNNESLMSLSRCSAI